MAYKWFHYPDGKDSSEFNGNWQNESWEFSLETLASKEASKPSAISIFRSFEQKIYQAGAELCQAQGKHRLAML